MLNCRFIYTTGRRKNARNREKQREIDSGIAKKTYFSDHAPFYLEGEYCAAKSSSPGFARVN